jgi:hypothetical protein
MGEARVTIDQFRSMLTAQPFQPFTLHLADGRQMHVPHPEFAGLFPSGRTVIIHKPDNTFEIIDLLLVVGLEARPASGSATQTA